MTFEQDFPSLKDEGLLSVDTNCLSMKDNVFLAKDIQKFCLDKVKVREAIEKHLVCGYKDNIHNKGFCRKCALLQSLGLDGEQK